MKAGSHLRIESMGDAVMGVRLEGNPRKPEPDHFRVVIPGGDVDITRCTDGTYWVHVRVNNPAHPSFVFDDAPGRITDARLDIAGKHASECDVGDFGNPGLYHLAVKIAR